MNLDVLRRQYAWNLAYADALTRDVPDELWARSGGPGLENHPAWTLGHLVTGSALVLADFGIDPGVPEAWRDLFERRGPNDPRRPDTDGALYPARDEVFGELRRLHDLVDGALAGEPPFDPDARDAWRFDGYLPTALDTLVFMLIAHENVHLGQLGCWRRRFELPSAMAAMGRGPA